MALMLLNTIYLVNIHKEKEEEQLFFSLSLVRPTLLKIWLPPWPSDEVYFLLQGSLEESHIRYSSRHIILIIHGTV